MKGSRSLMTMTVMDDTTHFNSIQVQWLMLRVTGGVNDL